MMEVSLKLIERTCKVKSFFVVVVGGTKVKLFPAVPLLIVVPSKRS